MCQQKGTASSTLVNRTSPCNGQPASHSHTGACTQIHTHDGSREREQRNGPPHVRDRRAARERASSRLPLCSGARARCQRQRRGSTTQTPPAHHPSHHPGHRQQGAPRGGRASARGDGRRDAPGCSTGLRTGPGPSAWGSPAPGPPGLTLRTPRKVPPAAALTPSSSLCRLAPSPGARRGLSARCPPAAGGRGPACSSAPGRDRARYRPPGPGGRAARRRYAASGRRRRRRSGSPRSRGPRGGRRGGAVPAGGVWAPGTGCAPCPPPPGQPPGPAAAPPPRSPAPAWPRSPAGSRRSPGGRRR